MNFCHYECVVFSNLCHSESLSFQICFIWNYCLPNFLSFRNYCHSEPIIPKGQANPLPEAPIFASLFNLGTKKNSFDVTTF